MPADYEKVLKEVKRKHPDMPLEEQKTMAAKITNASRKKQGKPAARFHRTTHNRKTKHMR